MNSEKFEDENLKSGIDGLSNEQYLVNLINVFRYLTLENELREKGEIK